MEQEGGILGLAKLAKSNKVAPEIVTNYTRVVFKDRLEILIGPEKEREDIYEIYPDILTVANQYYDRIFSNAPRDPYTIRRKKNRLIPNDFKEAMNQLKGYVLNRFGILIHIK